jgi:small-conductance mechanosensitive channel
LKLGLRLSGVVATLVFVAMVFSDLLMLTTLDFSRPYRFWAESPNLPSTQVLLGYYLGILTIPLYSVSSWHLTLALRPAPRWIGRLLLLVTAYCVCLLTVFHASFAFTRSILRAQGGASGGEAFVAFETLGAPMIRITMWLAGPIYLVILVLIARGKTLYPRWAAFVLPAAFALFAFPPYGLLPLWAAAVLRAAGLNVGGAIALAVSTMLLWNRDE